ncbi:MAG TPA: mechanosensitive ion channel family protein [Saprospiraceae bacterium]|jgi:small conductance mechanosensitive channel|nr:mechanosensitive ion channel family protein [Saprospiraceae bacterium]HRO08967.1 mechanosensitive ion channel family protein [Saprospiraceae bacterium]HRO72201.1 mechanosensitive ion channel family protein [Saprospiraceae bacterium]HRP42169.1 mechanosensitive ion channel family protein [Saprospiraceae bacterium]
MDTDFWLSLKTNFSNFITVAGIRLIYAAGTIIIGLFIIRIIKAFVRRVGSRSNADPSLFSFAYSLVKFASYSLLIFVVGIVLGIQASAFLTLLGAIGLAVGLSLQGSLSNFAGGILILLFKPFKIGDDVSIENATGVVDKIDILYTRIRTVDGRMITIPNGKVSNTSVENFSTFSDRQVKITLHLPFSQNIEELRQILVDTIKQHPKVLKNKPIQVWLDTMHEQSMKILVSCWCQNPNYWQVYFEQTENIKETLLKHNIQFVTLKNA